MATLHGVAHYPGLLGVERATYTCSHGLSPGTARVIVNVPPGLLEPLPPVGDLVITDGVGVVPVPACKLDEVVELRDGDGVRWEVRLRDRRWRWLECGSINLRANQLDNHGKLIGWMIRSPAELAEWCLKAMLETGYTIDMPPGIPRDTGADGFLQAGENYPPTGTNPPINWTAMPSAHALQQLCDLFGRRIVYNPLTNTVHIARPGVGAALPNGSIFRESPSIKPPARPEELAIVGSPTKYQGQFLLQAVGEEWDGSYKPLNALSYAPKADADSPQTTVVTITQAASGQSYIVTINGLAISFTASSSSALDVANGLQAAIQGAMTASNPEVFGVIQTVAAAGTATSATLTLTGYPGKPFYAGGQVTGGATTGSIMVADTTQAAKKGQPDWSLCEPPLFPGVPKTDRLSTEQARRLAMKSVWKYYQVVNLDVGAPAGEKRPISIPGYGPLKRRQQAVLLDTQVNQVKPEPGDQNFLDHAGEPLIRHYYDGYSRDKPAQVFGNVCTMLIDAWIFDPNRSINTLPTDPVDIPFQIDPEFQLVIFGTHVYCIDAGEGFGARVADKPRANPAHATKRIHSGRIAEPRLVLVTGCHVADPDTNQLTAYIVRETDPHGAGSVGQAGRIGVPGSLPPTVLAQHRPDVQLNVTWDLSDDPQSGEVKGLRLLELDAKYRAQYYLLGLQMMYPPNAAETRGYNGIVEVPMDGLTAQVTWTVGGAGAETIASQNTEHSVWIAPYPARRREELLRPAVGGNGVPPAVDRIRPGQPPAK